MRAGSFFRTLLLLLVCLALLAGDGLAAGERVEQVRVYTRMIEFDYIQWTVDAIGVKTLQSALRTPQYLSAAEQRRIVVSYLNLVQEMEQVSAEIDRIYSDPSISDPAAAAARENENLAQLENIDSQLKPLAESVIQTQISGVLAEQGLTLLGQPVPPVLYHTTPLPMALIVSPREKIQQDANISLLADLNLPEIVDLEKQVEQDLDVSALVVPVGGVGVYPTMVMSTTDLPWLLEVVAHEWTHNYLTLRPLGLNYETSPELRTMNETTAAIAGKEIGEAVVAKYYPELLPPPTPEPPQAEPGPTPQPMPTPVPAVPVFNYREEMHETRVTVDMLLEQGQIAEAEDYMEMRRVFFWEHGYQIRRLNQAYFAFYGAYADVPGGAAGRDPVGPAVRELRSRSLSLADFLNQIAWMTSFEQLQKVVGPVE